jgi:protocatechuate 3,4-dioxygenase beta subunit
MQRVRWVPAACLILVTLAATASTALSSPAATCRPTVSDGYGPFGAGEPPLRSKIGTGHVLVGTVLGATSCKPVAGARVEFRQANKQGRYTPASAGTVVTNRLGRFRFEGPRPGREYGEPHIHIRVTAPLFEQLIVRYVLAPGEKRGSIRLVLKPALL